MKRKIFYFLIELFVLSIIANCIGTIVGVEKRNKNLFYNIVNKKNVSINELLKNYLPYAVVKKNNKYHAYNNKINSFDKSIAMNNYSMEVGLLWYLNDINKIDWKGSDEIYWFKFAIRFKERDSFFVYVKNAKIIYYYYWPVGSTIYGYDLITGKKEILTYGKKVQRKKIN